MQKELYPESVLDHLKKGKLLPFYLFYGENDFQKNKIIEKIKSGLVSEELKELNFRIFYADEIYDDISPVLDFAMSFPFMSDKKLIVVKEVDKITNPILEKFLYYLEKPADFTCIIFTAKKPDFKSKFYNYIKKVGKAIYFRQFNESQTILWIRDMGKEMGMQIKEEACLYLYHEIGNNLDELYSELQKLLSCYGKSVIGIDEVKFVVSPVKDFTIFDLMDSISLKNISESLRILNRYMEREGKEKALIILGMIIRQLKLIQKTKIILRMGGDIKRLQREFKIREFLAKKFIDQSKFWSEKEIDEAFFKLYKADNLLKSGLPGRFVLEQAIISICS